MFIFIIFKIWFNVEIVGSGVSKGKQLLKRQVYACSTVVLQVPRLWKIWFLAGLEALQ